MDESLFQIGAEGVDADALVSEIRQAVEEKIAQGIYPDPDIARAERHNLAHLRDEDAFMDYYMNCLRQASHVDINEFEIASNGTWQFNLKSKNYTAAGRYIVAAVSGDDGEYTIEPACVTSFEID